MSAAVEVMGLQEQITQVESRLSEVLQDRSDLVTRMARHTAEAGGKRLRSMLCLLSGAFGDPARAESVVQVSAGLELIHLATLVHDDIVDRAATRRGRATAPSVWGSGLSVLAGDWLFASSFALLFGDDPRLARLVARMVRGLCAGAIEEAERAGQLSLEQQPYFDRICRKTAVFLETSCRAGALAGRAPPTVQDALGGYGRRVGMAFQIIDDILDLTGDPGRTGKPVGGDLRNGICTLPVMLGAAYPAVRRLLHHPFGRRNAGAEQFAHLVRLLTECGAIDRAYRTARDLAGPAERALVPLRGNGPVAQLAGLARLAVERDH